MSLLNEFRVYDFFIQKPCSPSGADILFSAGPSTTPGLMPYVSNPGNVVDSDPNNFAILNEPLQLLGLLAPAYIDVKFSKPGKSGNYVGFTIGNGTTSALDLSVLGQLKIDVYDESGTPRESKSNFNLLSLKLIQGTPNRYILGFVTQYSNYKIARARLTLNGVLGLALSVNVYNAYQQNVNTPLVVINVSGPTTFCTPGSVTLTAYDTLGTDYIWSNGAHTKSITVTQSGVYYVTVIDTINCNRRSIEIPVNVLPYLDVTIAGDTSLCPGTIGKLYTLQHYDTYTWSTGSTKDTISITNIGNYSVHVTKAPNCKGDDDVRVKDCNDHPPVIDTTVVLVHNIFTPNGDGINETLNIEGIQKYPNNEVRVFDKWGDMVFERRGYDNSNGWDGKLKGSADKGVPNGTYFYVIKLNAANPTGKTEYKGYLMIQR